MVGQAMREYCGGPIVVSPAQFVTSQFPSELKTDAMIVPLCPERSSFGGCARPVPRHQRCAVSDASLVEDRAVPTRPHEQPAAVGAEDGTVSSLDRQDDARIDRRGGLQIP